MFIIIIIIIIVFDRVFKTFFPCFFAGFLLSPKGSVMGCDSSLGSFY